MHNSAARMSGHFALVSSLERQPVHNNLSMSVTVIQNDPRCTRLHVARQNTFQPLTGRCLELLPVQAATSLPASTLCLWAWRLLGNGLGPECGTWKACPAKL
eukprot:6214571-Pleurochrysis_carterae.AAC.4